MLACLARLRAEKCSAARTFCHVYLLGLIRGMHARGRQLVVDVSTASLLCTFGQIAHTGPIQYRGRMSCIHLGQQARQPHGRLPGQHQSCTVGVQNSPMNTRHDVNISHTPKCIFVLFTLI